jgi:hypothetical protein
MGLLTDEKLGGEAARYGNAGSRPQVVWPNGVLAPRPSGLPSNSSLVGPEGRVPTRIWSTTETRRRSRRAKRSNGSKNTPARTFRPRLSEIASSPLSRKLGGTDEPVAEIVPNTQPNPKSGPACYNSRIFRRFSPAAIADVSQRHVGRLALDRGKFRSVIDVIGSLAGSHRVSGADVCACCRIEPVRRGCALRRVP